MSLGEGFFYYIAVKDKQIHKNSNSWSSIFYELTITRLYLTSDQKVINENFVYLEHIANPLEHGQCKFQFLELWPATSAKVSTFWNLHSIHFPTNGTLIWNPNKIFRMEPTSNHI